MERVRRRRDGDVMGYGRTRAADDSFETRVGRRITPRSDGCWQFDDGTAAYPIVYPSGRASGISAHRWVYFVANRLHLDDYPDHEVHHECENPNCVNPAHMLLLSHREHMERHAEMRRV